MRELRVQHQGEPYRVLYAFDPRRMAILLVGGKKTGDDRWYDTFVPLADQLYDAHLALLKKEGLCRPRTAMAINAVRHKRCGPGGSARRLHHSIPRGRSGQDGGETGSTRMVKPCLLPGIVPPSSG